MTLTLICGSPDDSLGVRRFDTYTYTLVLFFYHTDSSAS